MTLSGVSFAFEGQDAAIAAWTVNDTEGGYDQASGQLTEREWREVGSPSQGAALVARSEGSVVWAGRMAQPPQLKDGIASFTAVGHNAKADQRGMRLFIQSADMSQWVPYDADPHNVAGGAKYDHSRKWNVETTNHAIRFSLDRNQSLATGDGASVIFYAEGVDIQRVKWTQDYNTADQFPKLEIKVQRANGPTGAATNVTTGGAPISLGSGNNGGTFDISHAITGQDLILLMANCNDGTFTPNADKMVWMLTQVRVNSSITSADSYNASDVVTYIGGQLGWDTSGVTTSTFDVLPFDWENGSWLDAMTYVADLEDNFVRVGDEAIEYDAWGTRNWDVTQTGGANPDLQPKELSNQARVFYETGAGVSRKITRTTTDVGITDPLAAAGITNTIEATLEDRQRNSSLAQNVADKLVRRYARQRYEGTIDIVDAVANDGTDNPRLIRYGDTVTIQDWAPAQNLVLRVVEVNQGPTSVTVGLEQPVNLPALIAHTSSRRKHHRRRNRPRRVKTGGFGTPG